MSSSKSSRPKGTPKRRRPAPIDNVPIEDAVVASVRLGTMLHSILDKFFAEHDITLLQFTVLRILYVRDPEFQGIPTGTFAARIGALSPDVPRLIDRLAKLELLERAPSPADRRIVLVKLTQKGVDLMEEVVPLLLEHNRKLLGTIPDADHAKHAELAHRAFTAVLANLPGSAK